MLLGYAAMSGLSVNQNSIRLLSFIPGFLNGVLYPYGNLLGYNGNSSEPLERITFVWSLVNVLPVLYRKEVKNQAMRT